MCCFTNILFSGAIPIEYFYIDDTIKGNFTHYSYGNNHIAKLITGAKSQLRRTFTSIDELTSKQLSPSIILSKLRKEDWIYYALYNFTKELDRSKAAVIGSASPWVECLAIAVGWSTRSYF